MEPYLHIRLERRKISSFRDVITEFDCSHPGAKSFACKRRGSGRCLSAAVVGEEGETRKEFVLEGQYSGRKIKHFYSVLANTGNFIGLVRRHRPSKLA
jgi:hypothetical protein